MNCGNVSRRRTCSAELENLFMIISWVHLKNDRFLVSTICATARDDNSFASSNNRLTHIQAFRDSSVHDNIDHWSYSQKLVNIDWILKTVQFYFKSHLMTQRFGISYDVCLSQFPKYLIQSRCSITPFCVLRPKSIKILLTSTFVLKKTYRTQGDISSIVSV